MLDVNKTRESLKSSGFQNAYFFLGGAHQNYVAIFLLIRCLL